MQPGEDWWTFDTCHMAVSDVQVSQACVVLGGLPLAAVSREDDSLPALVSTPSHTCVNICVSTVLQLRSLVLTHV